MKSGSQGLAITFHSLPWLLGWASFSVLGPLVFIKVIYKTCLLAVSYFSDKYQKVFPGKVVLVTGASSGLGKALAHSLYKKGCKLILVSRNVDALEELKQTLLNNYNPPELHVPIIEYLDLEDLNAISEKVDKLTEIYGKIDVIINCAGISYRGEVASTELAVDLKVMLINYFGQIALIKSLLKHMISNKKGHIIGISSIQGKVSLPFRSCYGASKHAFQSFLDCLRAEVAHHNITVTTVCPSYIKTNLSVNAVTGNGDLYGVMDKSEASGMSPAYVAERIANCMITKQSEVMICPYLHRFVVFLQATFPSLVFYIMRLRAKSSKPESNKND